MDSGGGILRAGLRVCGMSYVEEKGARERGKKEGERVELNHSIRFPLLGVDRVQPINELDQYKSGA